MLELLVLELDELDELELLEDELEELELPLLDPVEPQCFLQW